MTIQNQRGPSVVCISFPFLFTPRSPMMHSRAELPFKTVICGSPTGGGEEGDTTERDENSLRVDGSTFHPKTFNPAKSHYSHSVPSRIVLEAMFDVRPIVVALLAAATDTHLSCLSCQVSLHLSCPSPVH